MSFDDLKCVYKVTYGGLLPNTVYNWKVTIDNSWKESYGNYFQIKFYLESLL